MDAVVYHKPRDVRVEEWPEPQIKDPRDALLQVTATAVCGSDLHIYNGMVPQLGKMVLGHEFVGTVTETGPAAGLAEGDRVVVPFPIACGQCWFCTHHLPTQCENSNPRYGPEGGLLKGKGAAIYGYTDLYGGKDGGQAERVRVPYADHGPRRVPDRLSDEEATLLADVVPTAWTALEWGEVGEGDSVAIFGCGPIGLMAQRLALLRGAGLVMAIDIEDYRLEAARRLDDVVPIHAGERDPAEAVRELTDGRGADVCIDAVGMEAHRGPLDVVKQVVHMERGTIKVLRTCLDAVRRGGTVVAMGVYAMPYDNFPLGQIFDKGVTLRGGQALVHEHIDDLMAMADKGKLRLHDMISHVLPLAEAKDAYEMFSKKKDGCIKVVLKP